jgi:hypothetical protein
VSIGEAGVGSVGMSVSPDEASTGGWSFGIECSAEFFTFSIGSDGVSGGLIAPPTKVGCGVKGTYTW